MRDKKTNENNKLSEKIDTEKEIIHRKLTVLMQNDQVKEAEIKRLVSLKGYYPESCNISAYDPSFVSVVLIGAWPQVLSMLKKLRKEDAGTGGKACPRTK